MFARGQGQNGKKKNGLFGMKKNGQRNNGQRPFTRAEALLVMLENNGIQPESLQTLRNTVTNQDVKQIAPEDHTIEQNKRETRRKEINRPKKSIQFALDNNMTREFRINDVVQRDEKVIKSAERNQPKTPGRLVKLSSTLGEGSDEDAATAPSTKAKISESKPESAKV